MQQRKIAGTRVDWLGPCFENNEWTLYPAQCLPEWKVRLQSLYGDVLPGLNESVAYLASLTPSPSPVVVVSTTTATNSPATTSATSSPTSSSTVIGSGNGSTTLRGSSLTGLYSLLLVIVLVLGPVVFLL